MADTKKKTSKSQKLTNSEEKFRSLFEQASDPIMITDFTGNFIDVNENLCKMFGYSKKELLSMNIRSLIDPEELKVRPISFDRLVKGAHVFNERRMMHKNGSIIEVEANVKKIDDGNVMAIARNITERKRSEEIIQKSEANIRSIFDSTDTSFVLVDKELKIITLNSIARERTKILHGDYFEPGKNVLDYVPAERKEWSKKNMEDVLAGNIREYESQMKTTNGELRWFFVKQYPIRDKNGEVIGICISGNDINERKKADELILKSEANLRSIFDNTETSYVLIDKELKIVTLNNIARERSIELYGKPLQEGEDLIASMPENRREAVKQFLLEVLEGKARRYEVAYPLPDGTKKLFQVIENPIKGNNGEVLGVCIASSDITAQKINDTELREAEIKFRSLVENSQVGVYIQQSGKFAYVNPMFAQIYGTTTDELISTLPAESWVYEEDRKMVEEKNYIRLYGDKENDHYEIRGQRKDGKIIWLEVYGNRTSYRGEKAIIGTIIDVTERKNIENELREAEAKFRGLVEKSLVGVYIIQNGKYAYVNPMFAEILGYTQDDLIETIPVDALVFEEERSGVQEKIRSRLEGEIESVHYELKGRKKNGEFILGEVFGTRTVYKGKPAIIGTFLDITERKKTETELRESEERYKALVENATEALVVFDMATRSFVSVSESATKLFKMSKEKLLQTGPIEVSPPVQPDGRPSSEVAIDFINKAVNGEKPVFEWMHCDAEGNLIQCEVRLVRLPSIQQVLIRGSIIDITDRKIAEQRIVKSEEKYRLLFESNPLPMWVISVPEFDITDVNESAILHYGFSREEFLAMNMKALRPKEDFEKFSVEAAKERSGINNLGIWRHKKKNGELIDVEIVAHDLIYEGQKRRIVHGNDVTKKIKAEKEMQQMNEQLRQLSAHLQEAREEERKYVAREIHDELGQLLTGIKMDASWISKKLGSSQQDLSKRVEDMLQLTDNTIESVRRIATELRPGILDDLGLEEAILWQVNEFQNKSGIRCHTEGNLKEKRFSPEISIVAFRILQESLTNILRHAQAKNVTIKMCAEKEDLFIEIKDDGVGINEEKQGKRKSLGIMGMRERAAMVGGTLDINSVSLRGTTIKINIPLSPQI